MPWVNVISARSCPQNEQVRIKTGMAEILTDVLDKGELGLTVTFQQASGFFRAGKSHTDGAVVEIKFIGKTIPEKKKELTRRTADLLNTVSGVSRQRIGILFFEFADENWGGKVGDFS